MIFFAPEKLLYTRGVSDTLCAWVVKNAQQPKEGECQSYFVKVGWKVSKTTQNVEDVQQPILQLRFVEEEKLSSFCPAVLAFKIFS